MPKLNELTFEKNPLKTHRERALHVPSSEIGFLLGFHDGLGEKRSPESMFVRARLTLVMCDYFVQEVPGLVVTHQIFDEEFGRRFKKPEEHKRDRYVLNRGRDGEEAIRAEYEKCQSPCQFFDPVSECSEKGTLWSPPVGDPLEHIVRSTPDLEIYNVEGELVRVAEFKMPMSNTPNPISDNYWWQVQFQMHCTGAKLGDFFTVCMPRYTKKMEAENKPRPVWHPYGVRIKYCPAAIEWATPLLEDYYRSVLTKHVPDPKELKLEMKEWETRSRDLWANGEGADYAQHLKKYRQATLIEQQFVKWKFESLMDWPRIQSQQTTDKDLLPDLYDLYFQHGKRKQRRSPEKD